MKILTPEIAKHYQVKSLQRGHFVFTSFLSVAGRFLFLDEHIERLLKGAHFLFADKGWNLAHAQVRQYVLREVEKMPDFFDESFYFRINIFDDFIFIQKEICTEKTDTVKAMAAYKRKSPGLIPEFLKVSNYLEADLELLNAKTLGFQDVFYFDQLDNVTEASTSNIFLVHDNNLIYTPPASSMVLDGIFRKKLLLNLKKSGFCVTEKSCTRTELLNAKEIWLTNSIKGLRFVNQFENKTFWQEKSLYNQIAKLIGRYGELL